MFIIRLPYYCMRDNSSSCSSQERRGEGRKGKRCGKESRRKDGEGEGEGGIGPVMEVHTFDV